MGVLHPFPELYIVPLDEIAFMQSANSPQYEEVLQAALESVYKGYSFMRFGGATHALLCLVQGCEHVMMDIVKSHPMGQHSRIIWIGSKEHMEGKKQWACPSRVVSLPSSIMQALGIQGAGGCEEDSNLLWMGVQGLLHAVKPLISGTGKWTCGRQKWNLNLGKAKFSRQMIIDKKHKLLYCGIPKCGITRARVLLRRMTGQPDWDIIDGLHVYGKKANLTFARGSTVTQLFEDTSWTKVAFVRHPAERFLSGYLNKVVYAKWYKVLDKTQKTKPSLEKFISTLEEISKANRLGRINSHFMGLSYFCGFERVRYDFLGLTSNMNQDMEDLLRSMHLWEEFGATGWGKNKSMSFGMAQVYKAPNHSGSIIHDKLTDDMLHRLYKIFHRDYEMFDFEEMDNGQNIERR